MTDTIPSFSVTQGGNNRPGSLFPELLPQSQMTDNLRLLQAAIRRQWNQSEWFEYGRGEGKATFNFVNATEFSVINAREAAEYHVGRRVRAVGTIVGTITGSITAVDENGGNTNVTVNWDTGGLSNENFIIELGILGLIDSSIPRITISGQDFAGDNVFTGNVSVGGDLEVDDDITAASGSFGSLSFNFGPLEFISQIRRVGGQAPIVVPDGTRQQVIEIWGPGGGGSGRGSVVGSRGETFTLTSNPTGRRLVIPGGDRGGVGLDFQEGQNQSTGTGLVRSGPFNFLAGVPGKGSPGGAGASGGVVGNPGAYIKTIVNATEDEITSWVLGGGEGGEGGGDGGNGGRASVLISFYG